jgi:hypothetical protein
MRQEKSKGMGVKTRNTRRRVAKQSGGGGRFNQWNVSVPHSVSFSNSKEYKL